MKKSVTALAVGLFGVAALLNSGCEWTGGGGTEGFNTSQGAGINVNFSGVYDGAMGGGKAVSASSGGTITRFVLIQVVDNQGSKYTGTVGAPGLVADPLPDGTFPDGVDVVQSQISFAGKDGVAAKDIEFIGIIHIIAVEDIKGETTTETDESTSGSGSTNSQSSSSSSEQTRSVTTSVDDGTNTTVTTVVTVGAPGDVFFSETTTTVVIDNETGREISRNVTTTGSSTSGSSESEGQSSKVTTTKTTTYSISEPESQWRLEGTWIEKGGVVASVDAISPGGVTVITTSSTTTE
jgi:hypothetical protein